MRVSDTQLLKGVLAINSVALFVLVFMLWVLPIFTIGELAQNYSVLARAYVINPDLEVLRKFTSNPRMAEEKRYGPIGIAVWLAKPALEAERRNAGVGAVVAATNICVMGLLLWRRRPRKGEPAGIGGVAG